MFKYELYKTFNYKSTDINCIFICESNDIEYVIDKEIDNDFTHTIINNEFPIILKDGETIYINHHNMGNYRELFFNCKVSKHCSNIKAANIDRSKIDMAIQKAANETKKYFSEIVK